MANEPQMESPHPSDVRTLVHVVVRLTDGGRVDAGSFADTDEARRVAEQLMHGFAQNNGRWPFVQGRYLRPEAIVSIDLVEEEHRRWTGSPVRRRIMGGSDSPA